MDTTAGWRRGDYKRACDICGHPYSRSKLKPIGQGRLACPDDYRGLTAEQITRYNAAVPPIKIRTHRNIRIAAQVDNYQRSEWELFSTVCRFATTARSVGPTGGIISIATAGGVAYCGVYLASVIEEGLRPPGWIARAKTALQGVAAYLLTRQFGAPGGLSPATVSTDILYGGVLDPATGNLATEDTGVAGLVFLACFRIFGEQQYIIAADRAAQFLRHLQRMDLRTANFTSNVNGGTARVYLGGWPGRISAGKLVNGNNADFYMARGVILWFLKELRDIRGGSTTYGEVTPGADFVSSTLGTLDQMISEALAFFLTGVAETGSATLVAGLVPGTLKEYFSPFMSSGGSAGAGHYHLFADTQVLGQETLRGLRGVFEVNQAAALAAYEYLLTFSSNPATNTPAGTSPKDLAAGLTGTYDPHFAFTFGLDLVDELAQPTTRNGAGSGYDLSTIGLFAPLRVASGRDLRNAKDQLARPRRKTNENTPRDGAAYLLGRFTECGLSFQVTNADTVTVSASAILGLAYRYAPTIIQEVS